MATEQKTCYVIMPFSKTTNDHTEDYWTRHFTGFLKPLIEEADSNLEARRSSPLRGDIVKQIITDLILAPIVVADLTDRNANVFWELGVRESFKHGTITIIDASNNIPFELSTKGTLHYYPGDHIKTEEFRTEFKAAVKDCLVNPNNPDSQVLEAVNGRGTLFELFRRDETIRRLDALLSEVSDVRHSMENYANPNQDGPLMPLLFERYRTMAVELLVVNRYLDEDQAFYQIAEDYLFVMNYVNKHVGRVDLRKFLSKPFLSRSSPLDMVGRFESKMTGIREKLVSQV